MKLSLKSLKKCDKYEELKERLINCSECKNYTSSFGRCEIETHIGKETYFNISKDYPNINGDCKYFKEIPLADKLRPLFSILIIILIVLALKNPFIKIVNFLHLIGGKSIILLNKIQ